MNLKNSKIFRSKYVGTGPSSYEKRIYRAEVSRRLRNTGLSYCQDRTLLCPFSVARDGSSRVALSWTRSELTGISSANVLAAFDCVQPVNTRYSTCSQMGVQESTTGVGRKVKLSFHVPCRDIGAVEIYLLPFFLVSTLGGYEWSASSFGLFSSYTYKYRPIPGFVWDSKEGLHNCTGVLVSP